jgi:hypothetical protein
MIKRFASVTALTIAASLTGASIDGSQPVAVKALQILQQAPASKAQQTMQTP